MMCVGKETFMAELKSETFEGLEGYWLRSGVAEAFVTARPFPRVAAFRRVGGVSPLWITTANQFFGVRTWFMEPVQLDTAPLPALQPAQAARMSGGGIRLTAGEEPTSGLQVTMEISLDAALPVLNIRHGLKNLRETPRTLAAWAINVVPHRGVAVTPLAGDPTIFRSYILFTGMDSSDPSLRLGKDAIGIDFRMPARAGWVKTGTNTDAGWVAYATDGMAIKSTVAYEPAATYPEGNGTITIYQSGKTVEEGFCEIENVGPFKRVRPGRTLWLDQKLELLTGVNIQGESADQWRAAVEQGRLD
jgi:hypothetical protein